MKVLIQWTLNNPTDWVQIEPQEWARLPKRPIPGRGQLGGQDNTLGWIAGFNVQGVSFNGYDHMAIEPIVIGGEESVKVTAWNDDPEDWPVGERQARIWTFLPLAPDPSFGNAINTRQSQIVYAEGARFAKLEASPPQNTSLRPWSEFVPPQGAITRHGVWLTDAKYREHGSRRWVAGWRHWADHLPQSETKVDRLGRRTLKLQREQGRWHQSSHTITYYQRDTDRAVGTDTFDHEDALELTTGTAPTTALETMAFYV